jgi:hypothetical protein
MDIRTLLTETKHFPTAKRKSASLSPSAVLIEKPGSPSDTYSSPVSMTSTTSKETPIMPATKKVKFTLIDEDVDSQISLVLNVSPTDPSAAITGTVKDFFALHESGVSFTDKDGSVLIITPENLSNGMEVYVNRVQRAETAHPNKKKKKSILNSRKKALKLHLEKDTEEVENEDDETSNSPETDERKEKILSSEVSIANILVSSRRKLSKFSSEVIGLGFLRMLISAPTVDSV